MLENDVEGVAWALETMVLARRELLPAIQNGNQGCGGRLRCTFCLMLADMLPESRGMPHNAMSGQIHEMQETMLDNVASCEFLLLRRLSVMQFCSVSGE